MSCPPSVSTMTAAGLSRSLMDPSGGTSAKPRTLPNQGMLWGSPAASSMVAPCLASCASRGSPSVQSHSVQVLGAESTDQHGHLLALTGTIEEAGNRGVPDHLHIQQRPSGGACTRAEGAHTTWLPT